MSARFFDLGVSSITIEAVGGGTDDVEREWWKICYGTAVNQGSSILTHVYQFHEMPSPNEIRLRTFRQEKLVGGKRNAWVGLTHSLPVAFQSGARSWR